MGTSSRQSGLCWCGNADLQAFSTDYLHCPRCESLVLRQMPTKDVTHVRNERADLYGKSYYTKHLPWDFGYPDLATRARTDLPERCLHWLRTVLKYKLPPARILELGSAHGGFVALLGLAGFESRGLELSRWLVEFARKTFAAPMLLGPVEDQKIKPKSLDLIALMDVLEHLPAPLTTLARCLKLLKTDGVILIQTPRYPQGKNLEAMIADRDRFREQLKPIEHLYLFSEKSVRELFHRLGADHLVFEPAIFTHYDMFFVVSRAPLGVHAPEAIQNALSATPNGRVMQALLDLDDQCRKLKASHAESEADRAARLDNVQRLEQLLAESERDRAARLEVIQAQGAQMARLHADLRHRQEQDQALHQQVSSLEAERQRAQERSSTLQQQLAEVEVDRTSRDAQIAELQSLTARLTDTTAHLRNEIASLKEQVTTLSGERDRWQAELADSRQQVAAAEADRAARSAQIDELKRLLNQSESEQRRVQIEIGYLRAHGDVMQTALRRLGDSPVYRFARALGGWGWLGQPIDAAARPAAAGPRKDGNRAPRKLRRVAVDVTPVLPGADNGGAKLVARELVRHCSRLAPSCEWILLTSARSHDELASWEGGNVRRICVSKKTVRPLRAAGGVSRWHRQHKPSSPRWLRQLAADLLFCPFTTARFFDPQVPLVSVVHDLQYLAYPEFFSSKERAHRDREFRDVCRFAARLVCVSDYVRGTVLQHGAVDPSRVTTIHTSLFGRLSARAVPAEAAVLTRLGLQPERFLLYPANYWPHKNHEMLLTAFGMYRARHPESDLKLVCTGGLSARREQLQEAVARMGLKEQIVLSDFVPEEEFVALLRACGGMIFPSLFEGFGMPVLEAMSFARPVLCSRLTSLPEIVGDAALLFDPRKPVEMANAIEAMETDPALRARLIERGRERLALFGDVEGMAQRYLQVFQEALSGGCFTPALHGVFSDGWTGERVTILHNPSSEPRYLEMTLFAPPWLPSETVAIRLHGVGENGSKTHRIRRNQTLTLRQLLPPTGGWLEAHISPTFQPLSRHMGADTRELGCLCRSCRILSPRETVELFGVESPT